MIYVVDSGDRERVEESKAAFDKMIKNETIKGIPLLVAANKQDLADCMGVREVKHLFENNVEGGCQQQQYHNFIINNETSCVSSKYLEKAVLISSGGRS